MKTSNYVIYVHVPETDEYYLVHGYSGAVDKVSPEVVQYMLDHADPNHTWHTKDQEIVRETLRGRELGEPSAGALGTLKSRGYLTDMSSAEERRYVERLTGFLHDKKVAGTPPGFMFIPTYECNLRCPYCFETETRVELGKLKVLQNVMFPEMVDAAYKCMDMLVAGRFPGRAEEKQRGGKITLYGGEPLTLETLPIVEYIFEEGVKRGYNFSAITNGVDLHHFLHLLGPGKIDFLQITLDGPKEIHNRKRIGPRYKGGTYDRIVENIKLALATGVHVSVRFHVDFNNIARTKELADDLKRENLHEHKNFTLYTYPIHMFHRGVETPTYPLMGLHHMHAEVGRMSKAFLAEQEAQAAASPEPKKRELKVLNVRMPDDGIRSKLKSYLGGQLAGLFGGGIEPCAATTGLYIFDPFWKIYSCWDNVGMAGHETGTYSPDGPVLNDMHHDWLSRSPATIEECKDCKYALFHFGGCASLPIGSKGTIFAPACYDFQDNFIHGARKFLRQGLDAASQTPTMPAAMHEASTAFEAGMAGD